MNEIDQINRSVLVLKCQLGDQSAWDELYRLYNPALGYYLRRLSGSDHAAADVQQETWLAVVRNIARLKSPEAFTVWFYRIAHSKAVNHLPKDSKNVSLDDTPECADTAENEEEFSAHDAARIHTGLGHLTAAHREVLLLRFMEDLSYEEIAEIVECNLGTVRSRIHNAKRALRHILENAHE